jgi:hypothetical protein
MNIEQKATLLQAADRAGSEHIGEARRRLRAERQLSFFDEYRKG